MALEMIRACVTLVALAVQSLDVFVDTTIESALGRHGGGLLKIMLWKMRCPRCRVSFAMQSVSLGFVLGGLLRFYRCEYVPEGQRGEIVDPGFVIIGRNKDALCLCLSRMRQSLSGSLLLRASKQRCEIGVVLCDGKEITVETSSRSV